MELPEFLASGAETRLVPAISESNKENKATSVMLATLRLARPFAVEVLTNFGVKLGKRSKIKTYTEVVPKGQHKSNVLRPDGLIVVETGKNSWRAFVESKTGNATLDAAQIEAYLQLAREHNIDAVITVSNEFAALPSHHPVPVNGRLTRKTDLFHLSWAALYTYAYIVYAEGLCENHHEAAILSEFISFISDPKAGKTNFTRMNEEWPQLVKQVQLGNPIQKGNDDVLNTVGAWHQELRDVALQLSASIGSLVGIWLPRSHRNDPKARLLADCAQLCDSHQLAGTLEIKSAENIDIVVDLRARTVQAKVKISAPLDKKGALARTNWLLRQLKDLTAADVAIGFGTKGAGRPTILPCLMLQADTKAALETYNVQPPTYFEVQVVKDLAGSLSQRGKFIEHFEKAILDFYKNVGQHVQDWTPPPPKFREPSQDAETASNSVETEPAGNQAPNRESTYALDIPDFLRRISTPRKED